MRGEAPREEPILSSVFRASSARSASSLGSSFAGIKRPGQYTNKERLDIVEDLDAWRETDEGRGRSVSEFVRSQRLPDCFNKKLSKGKYGWCFPATRSKLVQLVADGLRKICRSTKTKPKYPLVESLLIQEMKEKRTRGKKVSERWMRVRSKQLMKDKYPEAAKTWKGSHGYQRRLCKRAGFVPRRVTNHFRRQAGGDQKIPQDPSRARLQATQQWRRATPQMGEVEATQENVG